MLHFIIFSVHLFCSCWGHTAALIPWTKGCINSNYDHTTKPCIIKSNFFSVPVIFLEFWPKFQLPILTKFTLILRFVWTDMCYAPQSKAWSYFIILDTSHWRFWEVLPFLWWYEFQEALESTDSLCSPCSLEMFGLHQIPLSSSKAQAAIGLSGSPEQVR